MIERIRSGGRVPFADEQREIRSPCGVDNGPGGGIEHTKDAGFLERDCAIGGVEERKVARISMSGNEVTADPFRRVVRGGLGGVRNKFGNPFCLGGCRTADATGGAHRFDGGARKVIQFEILLH